MNEFDLIARLAPLLPGNPAVLTGAGDDCAVLDLGVPGQHALFKTDAVVEGIHFTRDTPPEKVGRKVLARCLSDIAAMGGTPAHAVITLGLPRDYDPAVIERLYVGMAALARAHGVALVGGETTTNPGQLLLSVALLGSVPAGGAILRAGARAGDALFVTGELGGSLAGHHLDFEPRVAEGRWLAANFRPTAMLDLSDGIAGDLRHLLGPAGCGAEIAGDLIPIRRAARATRPDSAEKPPLLAALTDGEDYELLFTQPPSRAVALKDAWREKFPATRLTCIGKLVPGHGIRVRDARGLRELHAHGYAHFS